MKIEVLAARAERQRIGARERLVAGLPRTAPMLARLPWAARLQASRPARAALARLGFAPERSRPVVRRDYFRDEEAGQGSGPEVLLLADTFNRWFEPENLRAAVRVLRAAGFRPRVPASGAHPLCCGRTYLAAGMVERARAAARRTLSALAGDAPVVGLEPSCLLTLRDEFRSLLPGAATDALAGRALLLSEFLEREKAALPLKPVPVAAHVHGHCHQKSFGAFPAALAALRRVPELAVRPIASSCCGMAGAFGYQKETQEVSRAMAELALIPAVRAATPADLIVADGTSCRHQIRDLAGREAVHSVRVLERALA